LVYKARGKSQRDPTGLVVHEVSHTLVISETRDWRCRPGRDTVKKRDWEGY
jgi:hypothetical protein